ncbi:DUF4384 domain-containing protein [Rhodoferax sp. AJA081-3]|uniref:DUF4384 domain-containing protein n=1 Tax=Rhodoferax sp. AJA081-3 TaxID=2752316 RepID=UPI001ADF32D9|nr:DUF4384 domain-containing protein [Rhodoferax sp. AJA081-3]QTN27988.1 DUF4384 domain-containing protein [Rhodoferax sp. AJA081-3]
MTKVSTTVAGCALGLVLVFGGCAVPSKDAPVDANWLQRMDGVLRKATPALQVRVQPAANPVKQGEVLKLRVFSNTAGFVYLLQLDSDGKALRLVFPNAMDDANFMGAGYIDLPRGNWQLPARGPTGVAYLMAVMSPTQLDLPALQAQLAYGRFELMGTYGAAMVPLRGM